MRIFPTLLLAASLTACTNGVEQPECALAVFYDENYERCHDNSSLEEDTLACCPEGWAGIGYDHDGAVLCVDEERL